MVNGGLEIGKDKFVVGVFLKVNYFYNGIQIDGAVYMRERVSFGDAWRWTPAGWRLPLQGGGKKRGFDQQQHKSALRFVEIFRNRQNL